MDAFLRSYRTQNTTTKAAAADLELFLGRLDALGESPPDVADGEVDGFFALGAVRAVDRHL